MDLTMTTLTKEKLFEVIEDIPKALYSGGLYIKYGMNGLWYCGYDNTVFHTSDRNLSVALDMLQINLKMQGYVD
jgi:hypothetical protein